MRQARGVDVWLMDSLALLSSNGVGEGGGGGGGVWMPGACGEYGC